APAHPIPTPCATALRAGPRPPCPPTPRHARRLPRPRPAPTIPPMPAKKRPEFDVIEPIGKRVVIRKDENKRETRSGIVLPDSHEIPVITGRVIAISRQIENDDDLTIPTYH